MRYKVAPHVFHDKEDKPSNFVMYPSDLVAAINNLFSGNETKVLLALLGCKGDGSFCASTTYMLNVTGISKANHFTTIRKSLTDRGYLSEIDGDVYVNTTKIMEDYQYKMDDDAL